MKKQQISERFKHISIEKRAKSEKLLEVLHIKLLEIALWLLIVVKAHKVPELKYRIR